MSRQRTLDGACRTDHELGAHVQAPGGHGVGLGTRPRLTHLGVGADDRGGTRAVFVLQTLHIAVVDQRDASLDCIRQIGDECALLRVVGAAQGAEATAHAAAHVELEGLAGDAERRAATAKQPIVAVDGRFFRCCHADTLAHLPRGLCERQPGYAVVRRAGLEREPGQALLALPALPHALHGTEAQRHVHGGPAPDALTTADRNAAALHEATALARVEHAHVPLVLVEEAARVVPTALEHHDAQVRLSH